MRTVGKLWRLLIVPALLGAASSAADDLAYVTANQTLEGLPEEMARYYTKLDAKNELPVRWVRDDIGLEVSDVAYALGLLRGRGITNRTPSEFEELLCRLNSQVCKIESPGKNSWRNKKNSRLCVPAVAWTDALSVSRTYEYPAKGLDWLEGNFGTCSAIGTKDCRRKVEELAKLRDRDGWMPVPVLAQAALQLRGEPITQCGSGGDILNISEQLSNNGYEYLRKLRPEQTVSRAIDQKMRKSLVAQGYRLTREHFEFIPTFNYEDREHFFALKEAESFYFFDYEDQERVAASWEAGGIEIAMNWGAVEAWESETAACEVTACTDGGYRYMTSGETSSHASDISHVESENSSPTDESLGTESPVNLKPTDNQPGLSSPPPIAERLTPPFGEALRDISLDKYFAEKKDNVRSNVMVFDFKTNRCHPLIRHAVAEELCKHSQKPVASYSLLSNSGKTKIHHGTHISALVAGSGIGVRPEAKLDIHDLSREGEGDKTILDNTLEQTIINAIVDTRLSSVKVVNFSVELNPHRGSDFNQNLQNTFQKFGGLLYVAAAGNDAVSLTGPCQVVPACLESDYMNNIIVVGGAKKTAIDLWSLYERSSYGPKVDILAPAENVLSAANDSNSLVRLSGTSQAAALVSGVAARLFDAPRPPGSEWQPSQVKNRLKATARLFPELTGKTSSGLLSADSALDDQQVLIYESQGRDGLLHEVTVRGQLIQMVDATGDGRNIDGVVDLVATKFPSGRANFCRMYRYRRAPTGDVTFFYEPDSGHSATRWLLMDSYTNGRLLQTTKQLAFAVADGPIDPILVPVRRVVDFTDKFSGERACRDPKQ